MSLPRPKTAISCGFLTYGLLTRPAVPHYLFTPGVPLHLPIPGFIYVFNYFCLFYLRTVVAAGPVGYLKLCVVAVFTRLSPPTVDVWPLLYVSLRYLHLFAPPLSRAELLLVGSLSARSASVKYCPLKVVKARLRAACTSCCILNKTDTLPL